MEVKIVRSGGERPDTVEVDRGASIEDCLEQAGIDANGASVQLNSEDCELSETVRDGDIITLAKNVKGA